MRRSGRRRALRRRHGHSASPLSPTLSPRVKQWVEETEAARAELRESMRDEASGVHHTARPERSQAQTRRARERKEHTAAVRRIARLGKVKRRELAKEKTLRAQQHTAETREAACTARETKRIASLAKKAATARDKAHEADREIVEIIRRYPTATRLASTIHT